MTQQKGMYTQHTHAYRSAAVSSGERLRRSATAACAACCCWSARRWRCPSTFLCACLWRSCAGLMCFFGWGLAACFLWPCFFLRYFLCRCLSLFAFCAAWTAAFLALACRSAASFSMCCGDVCACVHVG